MLRARDEVARHWRQLAAQHSCDQSETQRVDDEHHTGSIRVRGGVLQWEGTVEAQQKKRG